MYHSRLFSLHFQAIHSFCSSQNLCAFIPILQKKKLRPSEVKKLVSGPTAEILSQMHPALEWMPFLWLGTGVGVFLQWHWSGQNVAGDLSLLQKQLPLETRSSSGAQLVWTVHLLWVLVPTDTFPKAVLAYAMLHRMDRRSDWPSQAGLLPEKMSVPLVWTVLWIQDFPREDTCPLGRESSMSDLGQVGRPEFWVGVHVTCLGVDQFCICFGSEQVLKALPEALTTWIWKHSNHCSAFIRSITKYFLNNCCVEHCPRLWVDRGDQNRQVFCPCGIYILVEFTFSSGWVTIFSSRQGTQWPVIIPRGTDVGRMT